MSKIFSQFAMMLACSASMGGCASMTHYNSSRNVVPLPGSATSMFIDAKQRAILAAAPENPTANNASMRLCAEPSPDALSALAASQGIGLKSNNIDLSQAMSLAESSGSIGLRTQSIQLMRDEMYRTCEMYLSGAISGASWESMHRRSQSLMVATLAIEQLTGTVKARPIILGGSGGTGNAEAVVTLTNMTETARDAMLAAKSADDEAAGKDVAAKADVKDKTDKLAAANADGKDAAATALTTAKATADAAATDLGKKDQTYADLKAAYDSINGSRLAALSGQTVASATGSIGADDPPVDSATAAIMAVAVNTIVTNALQLSYGREICAGVLNQALLGGVPADNPVLVECLDLLKGSPPPLLDLTTDPGKDGKSGVSIKEQDVDPANPERTFVWQPPTDGAKPIS